MRRGLIVVAIAAIGTFFTCMNGYGAEIVLRGITAFPRSHLANDPVPLFIEQVEKRTGGRVKIDWIGGPEVIKSMDQVHALKAGTVDMVLYMPMPYMKALLPVAEAKALSELTQWEQRKSGAYEIWSEILAKRVNAKYLGSPHSYVGYHIYSNKKIEKIADFKGMKIRAQPLYIPLLKALGATPVAMPPTEIYTAMERGVVDAFMWPKVGMISWGLHEITKYVLDPPILKMGSATVMNLDKWNSMPTDIQEIMSDVMKDVEYAGAMRNIMIGEYEDNIRRKAGMEYIRLPADEAGAFEQLAYEKTWEVVFADSPDDGPRLKKAQSRSALPAGSFPWQ